MKTLLSTFHAVNTRLWRLLLPRLLCSGALALGSSAAVQADDAVAKKIVSGVCFLCHGMQGESNSEMFPRLAGQHWEYTARQLEHFKSGVRKSTAMADMASRSGGALASGFTAWPTVTVRSGWNFPSA